MTVKVNVKELIIRSLISIFVAGPIVVAPFVVHVLNGQLSAFLTGLTAGILVFNITGIMKLDRKEKPFTKIPEEENHESR